MKTKYPLAFRREMARRSLTPKGDCFRSRRIHISKNNVPGKYRGRVQTGAAQDGYPINKHSCTKALHELERKKEDVRKHCIEGEPLGEDIPFYQYAEEWHTDKRSPSSLRQPGIFPGSGVDAFI